VTTERHPTEIFVEQVRELLKPSPVRLHSVPCWLAHRVRQRPGPVPEKRQRA
jgi:hypothetical protein